jgi:cystathionine beta-lyase
MLKMMKKDWKTKLIHPGTKTRKDFRSLVTPVYRASTVTFPDSASIAAGWDPEEVGYTYGVFGTPTTLEFAARIAELENGTRTLLTPSGLSAIALVDLAFLSAGSHVLLPTNVYLPSRLLAVKTLQRFGIEAEFYPFAAGSAIEQYLRPNTHLIWTESPGSVTMEIQDIPAIAAIAHRHGIPIAMDNTWSAGVFFTAFEHGADISLQAATKYIGGHSDLLLGTVTVCEAAHFARLGETRARLGLCVSPDECSLALRGLQTLAVRLRHVEASALRLAQWLEQRPEIEIVLHPALPSCPDHALWVRDFSGSSGLFSAVFRPEFTGKQVRTFVDALALFKIGFSWGGVTSLAAAYDLRTAQPPSRHGNRLVRFSVGLEECCDLQADLEQALKTLSQQPGSPCEAT